MKMSQKCFVLLLASLCFVGMNLEGTPLAQKIVIDETGAGIAVWSNNMGTYHETQAATINSSGVWSSPVTLSSAGVDCSYPIVVMNEYGDAVCLWSEFNTGLGLNILKAAIRPSGSSWQASTQISLNTEDVAVYQNNFTDAAYRMVINDLGVVIATWISTVSGSLVVRSSRYADGSWSAPVTISP